MFDFFQSPFRFKPLTILFLVILSGFALLMSCKKKTSSLEQSELNVVNPTFIPIDSDFIFFPKKNAKWIVRSDLVSPNGNLDFIDTFYIGVDTLINTWTYNSKEHLYDEKTLKKYTQLNVYSKQTYPNKTVELVKQRFCWFRQSVSEKRIFCAEVGNGNEFYDRLTVDLGLSTGDRAELGGNFNGEYPIVILTDSIKFGNRYLKRIRLNWSTYYLPEFVQGRDFPIPYQIKHFHPTSRSYWIKFIYKTDTMLNLY